MISGATRGGRASRTSAAPWKARAPTAAPHIPECHMCHVPPPHNNHHMGAPPLHAACAAPFKHTTHGRPHARPDLTAASTCVATRAVTLRPPPPPCRHRHGRHHHRPVPPPLPPPPPLQLPLPHAPPTDATVAARPRASRGGALPPPPPPPLHATAATVAPVTTAAPRVDTPPSAA